MDAPGIGSLPSRMVKPHSLLSVQRGLGDLHRRCSGYQRRHTLEHGGGRLGGFHRRSGLHHQRGYSLHRQATGQRRGWHQHQRHRLGVRIRLQHRLPGEQGHGRDNGGQPVHLHPAPGPQRRRQLHLQAKRRQRRLHDEDYERDHQRRERRTPFELREGAGAGRDR